MRKFQKVDEPEQQALSIVQRSSLGRLCPHSRLANGYRGPDDVLGNIEVLNRRPHSSEEPTPASESETEGEEFPRPNEGDRYARSNESETLREAMDRRR